MLHSLLHKLCYRSRVMQETRHAAGAGIPAGPGNTRSPNPKRSREESREEEAPTDTLAAEETLRAILREPKMLLKLVEGIENFKKKHMKECHKLLYTLMDADETPGSLVCAVHKYAALSHCHGAQTKKLTVNQEVTLVSWDRKNRVQAMVRKLEPRGRLDYVYFETKDLLISISPERFDINYLYEGMPINVVGLYLHKPCVESFGNLYSTEKAKLGHYEGSSAAYKGESGALVVSNTGAIIGMNVGAYKTDPNSFKTGSHRHFVPIALFEEELNLLDAKEYAEKSTHDEPSTSKK